MYEVACEPSANCNLDQQSFKAYLSRWMAATVKVAPWTHDTIMPLLKTSAAAAAKICNGAGVEDATCGSRWYDGTNDGKKGVGQQMSALEAIQSMLIDQVDGPVGNSSGGTSRSDNPNVGFGGDDNAGVPVSSITLTDRAGAGVMTALVCIGLMGGAWWMVV